MATRKAVWMLLLARPCLQYLSLWYSYKEINKLTNKNWEYGNLSLREQKVRQMQFEVSFFIKYFFFSCFKFFIFFSVTFVVSNRGGHMVLHNGFTFTEMKDKRTKCKVVRWTCSKRMRYRCKAKLRTLDNRIISSYDFHNHDWVLEYLLHVRHTLHLIDHQSNYNATKILWRVGKIRTIIDILCCHIGTISHMSTNKALLSMLLKHQNTDNTHGLMNMECSNILCHINQAK